MFLLASLALAAPPPSCRISNVHLDVAMYIELSASMAILGIGPVPLGTNPDPAFDNDMPIEYTLIPSAGALTLMVTRQEARPTDSGIVDIVPISYMFTVDSDGIVRDWDKTHSHSCSTRRAIASVALAKLQEMYRPAR